MYKDLLKSAINFFILFGFLSSLTPSYGMEWNNDDEKKEELLYHQRPVPTKLEEILIPFTKNQLKLNQCHSSEETIDSNELFSGLTLDLIKKIIFLDFDNLVKMQAVSKKWRAFSIQEIDKFIKVWKPGEKDDKFIEISLSKPYYLFLAHQILAPHFPLDPNASLPEVISQFASAIKTSPSLFNNLYERDYNPYMYRFLAKLYLNHINVLDIKKTKLAGYVTCEVPMVGFILRNIISSIKTSPNEFIEIAKNTANHKRLHQFLMALKVASNGNNQDITQLFTEFDHVMTGLLLGNDLGGVNPNRFLLMRHPFWGAYLQNFTYLYSFTINHSGHWKDMSPKLLRALCKQSTLLKENTAPQFKRNYLLSLLNIYNQQGNKVKLQKTLNKLTIADLKWLITANPSSQFYYAPICNFIWNNQCRNLSLALALLEKAYEQFKDDPIYLRLGVLIADCILQNQDENRYGEVETYLEEAINPPQNTFSPLPLNYHIWTRQPALALRANLRIYQRKYMEALEDLKTSDRDMILDSLHNYVGDPNFPNELITLIGNNEFEEFFDFNDEDRMVFLSGEHQIRARTNVLRQVSEYKWFFDEAFKRGLLNPAIFKEVIDLCSLHLGPLSQESLDKAYPDLIDLNEFFSNTENYGANLSNVSIEASASTAETLEETRTIVNLEDLEFESALAKDQRKEELKKLEKQLTSLEEKYQKQEKGFQDENHKLILDLETLERRITTAASWGQSDKSLKDNFSKLQQLLNVKRQEFNSNIVDLLREIAEIKRLIEEKENEIKTFEK